MHRNPFTQHIKALQARSTSTSSTFILMPNECESLNIQHKKSCLSSYSWWKWHCKLTLRFLLLRRILTPCNRFRWSLTSLHKDWKLWDVHLLRKFKFEFIITQPIWEGDDIEDRNVPISSISLSCVSDRNILLQSQSIVLHATDGIDTCGKEE